MFNTKKGAGCSLQARRFYLKLHSYSPFLPFSLILAVFGLIGLLIWFFYPAPVLPDLCPVMTGNVHEFINTMECPDPDYTTHDPSKAVAIIIPYRDRPLTLPIGIRYIYNWLTERKHPNFRIVVVEQAPNQEWNKGSLFNAAFFELQNDFDSFVLQDVDQMPSHPCNSYRYRPPGSAFHLDSAPTQIRCNLMYPELVGGALQIHPHDFIACNGFSNRFLGWGGEDDDFSIRLRQAKIPFERFPEPSWGKYDSMMHSDGRRRVSNVEALLDKSWTIWQQEGLNTIRYKVLDKKKYHLYDWMLVDVDVKQ